MALDQIGQGQIFEHEIQKLILSDLKYKLIHPFAAVTGLAPTLAATAAIWPGNAVASAEITVARMHPGLTPTLAVVENRLIDIPARNADLLAASDVGNRTATHGFFDRLLDMGLVTAQEPLPVHCALVLAV